MLMRAKRFRQIDLGALIDELARAEQRVGEPLEQRFDHLHEIAVIGVGLVQLEHGEFGVVLGRHALVAEISVDLVDALEAAHGQALQIQLRRDAQVHVDVERVVMGLEGTRRGAAGNRVQHRRLDLEEAARIEERAQVAHDRASASRTRAGSPRS